MTDVIERLIFDEAIKRGVDQDTADQVSQAVAEALTQQREPTAEMIEAGGEAHAQWLLDDTPATELVQTIYLAMERVRMKGEG